MSKRRTTEEFINEARIIHGDKYDYSKVQYVRADKAVCIVCPVHGEFWQKPVVHINLKCKCPLCANLDMSERFADSKDVFVSKAKAVHGDKYDYSKVKYVNNHTPVTIICPQHGEFTQIPKGHLGGNGCSYCSGKRMNLQTFIEKAKEIHHNRYDYSKVIEYKDYHTKVCVVCPSHGEFWVTPSNHLSGTICPKCNRENRRIGVVGGIGVSDVGSKALDDIKARWAGMLERCYSKIRRHRSITYDGCEVCEDWRIFSNFKAWCDNPENGYRQGYHIDKDLLSGSNKIYSPNTCCFLPSEINEQFRRVIARRGIYPIGVRKAKNRYAAYLNGRFIGSAETPEEAFLLYKAAKEKRVKELAVSYYSRGEITKRVYDAMMQWELIEQ